MIQMKRAFILIVSLALLLNFASVTTAAQHDVDSVMKKIIVMPKNTSNSSEADNMIARLSNINYFILTAYANANGRVKLVDGPITNEPEYKHLKGVTPRGWEGTGKTWDDVPGVGGNPVIVRIGYSDYNKGHGSINLELHETAHAIDMLVFNSISATMEFQSVWNKEVNNVYKGDPYFTNYVEEYFAESFAKYYLNETSKKELKAQTPLTYKFIEDLTSLAILMQFTDIEGHWAESTIVHLINEGIVSGDTNSSFNPNQHITREQFIKLLIESQGYKLVKGKQTFSDVTKTRWSNPYIEAAVEQKIIIASEYSSTFAPTEHITRLEMAVFAARALQLAEDHSKLTFIDKDQIKQNKGLVGAAVKAKIVTGFQDNSFRPLDTATRAEATVIIQRIINYREANSVKQAS